MAVYEYTAKNATNGQILKGTLDVPTRDEVMAYLKRNRMILVASGSSRSSSPSSFPARESRPATW